MAADPTSLPLSPADIEAVTEAVVAAGDHALEWFRRPLHVENKGEAGAGDPHQRWDPVTEADRAVEARLRAALSARFADHQIVGEEAGASGDGRYRWIIDPIDGTRAFVTGQPQWGTLLGLQDRADGDRPLAGWLYQPVLGHLYRAAGGRGELRAGADAPSTALATSGVRRLDAAVLMCTHPDMFAGTETDDFNRVASAVRMTRFGGDCLNYGYLATGFADLVVENRLQAYDVVPLIPLIEASGGIITDREGRVPLNGGWAVAAATAELHAAALDLLNQ